MDYRLLIIITGIASIILGVILGYLWNKTKMQKLIDELKTNLNIFDKEIEQHKNTLEKQRLEWEKNHINKINQLNEDFIKKEQELKQNQLKQEHQLNNEIVKLKEEIKNWERKWEDEQLHFREKEQKFKEEFENLAQKILDEKSEKFSKQNKENLDQILNPFTEAIKSFKEKVIETDKLHHGRHEALYEQLKQLKQLNSQLSQEAINLTKALKGESKTQGIWGETILNRLLEKSGLEKDREYFVQQSFNVEQDGKQKRLQPDVIIHLPNNKKMIIDAKVSLTAYEKSINADDDELEETFLKEHIRSIKQHIDGLRKKKYDELLQGESPEFILMFIPIEPAFSMALKEEPELYNYAFNYNIILVTPSTLLATLKIVDNMWTNERQTRNAIEIAEEAGKLHDKFALLLENIESIGKNIDRAKVSYNKAMTQMTGAGNLIGKVDKLKKLGAKAKKQLPPNEE